MSPSRSATSRRRFPVPEASLAEAASGLVPASEGWFVVNAADAAWVANPDFGWRCSFEANGPALRESPELEQVSSPSSASASTFSSRASRAACTTPSRSRRTSSCSPASASSSSRRRNGTCAPGTSSTVRPALSRLRRDGRAVRAPHDRRAVGRGHDPLPALRGGRSTRRRRRGRDVLAARGVCAPSTLAARASRD